MPSDSDYMMIALEEARKAFERGEVPVGAVTVRGGEVVARCSNRVEELQDASAHAEILALRETGAQIKNWRLSDVTLYVTLEPCVMCAAACRLSRVKRIVFGAPDTRFGGLGTFLDLSHQGEIGPIPQCSGGIEAEQSAELLRRFFRERREQRG